MAEAGETAQEAGVKIKVISGKGMNTVSARNQVTMLNIAKRSAYEKREKSLFEIISWEQ